jgi:predicted lysophospholipase L1 biosynthesis ABC-type transport system permease subunit
VWADPALLDALHLKAGDTVRVGLRTFTVAASISASSIVASRSSISRRG